MAQDSPRRLMTTVRVWDGKTGAHIATLDGHSNEVKSVTFSADGSRLASASDDETVRLWDGKTRAHIARLDGHSNSVNSVTFSSHGSRLASASHDHTVRLWDGKTGAHIATLEGHSSLVESVAFSADDSRLASVSVDKTVRLWDGKTGVHIITLNRHSFSVDCVTFSAGDSSSMSLSHNTTRQWDTITPSIPMLPRNLPPLRTLPTAFPPLSLRTLTGHKNTTLHAIVLIPTVNDFNNPLFILLPLHLHPRSHAQSPTSPLLAVGCRDGQVFILDFSEMIS